MNHDMDPEVDNPDNYRFTIFYFNANDKRVIVPKRNRYFGWTLNFGSVYAYLILGSLITIILLSEFFL